MTAPVSELESHLGYWLRFVSNHVSHRFQAQVEAQGVTVSEWVTLREMYRLGPVSPGELAQAVGMNKSAISKLLARLEHKALTVRAVNDRDRRQHAVALTAAGEALVPVLARIADDNDERFFGHLPPDTRQTLQALLTDIVRRHQLKTLPVD